MRQLFFSCITVSFCLLLSSNSISQNSPRLEKRGNATQLIVDGKPFLVLGGELHNSSSSNLDYLTPLWEPIRKMNYNTALVAVSWELIEPQEGKFDFSLVDSMLKGAREAKLKLILLWFGSWKNGLSHYTPEWVKKDARRFPRISNL
jgi:beta-galactosidase GanA